MSTQDALWIGAGAAAAIAVVAIWADRRRMNRRDLDRPGIAPWALIQVLAMLIAAVLAALALKA